MGCVICSSYLLQLVARDLPQFLHILEEMKQKVICRVCVAVVTVACFASLFPLSFLPLVCCCLICIISVSVQIPAVTEHVQQLSERVLRPEASTESGISLLEVKQHLLLRYMYSIYVYTYHVL